MPLILIAFIIYLVAVLVSWFVHRKLGIALFVVFLAVYIGVLAYHMTDNLPVSF